MKKEKSFIIKILISLFLIIILIIPNQVNAAGLSWGDIEKQANAFIDKGESNYPNVDSKMEDIVIPIARMLVMFGNIVVVIAITVIGIKYLMATPDTKAKLKTQLIGVVIATVVIFGGQLIWSITYNFLSNF